MRVRTGIRMRVRVRTGVRTRIRMRDKDEGEEG